MTTTEGYVLGRTDAEYERLRAQARVWEQATATLLDRVGLAAGARCLDVGCGPGETMRLMAERAGPGGTVVGMDIDAAVGASAVAMLHAAGHRQCTFVAGDATRDDPPAGGYDLVFARLLLLHLTEPVAALRRMWQWVAPGGHLVVQDYDMRTVDVDPPLPVVAEWRRVFLGTFTAAGRDIRLGHRLPHLFAEAGLGAPDGIEVTGRMEPLRAAGGMLAATYRSVAPAAVSLGIVTEPERDAWLSGMERAMTEHGDHTAMWPLLIGVHKQRG
ncbi:methyltransferase domain-containing protein [Actinoplanes sp. NBC_00393]|uniref:methyltransferase domain-containing protein n=1 Tax=Actinoplanes sp. NBC_00393 TaxID=2975953 RepID=UPI002E20C2BE